METDQNNFLIEGGIHMIWKAFLTGPKGFWLEMGISHIFSFQIFLSGTERVENYLQHTPLYTNSTYNCTKPNGYCSLAVTLTVFM